MKGGPFHILVLGKEGVGKTAVVVRYLTGRYLSEYAHADENVYERTVNVDGKSVSIKITDVGGKNIERKASNKDLLFKVDGVVVVYSVTDRHSFDVAEAIVDWMKKDQKNSFPIPIVLLGNKCDLDHSRVVAKQDAGDEEDLEWRNSGYMISDCSACSGSDTIIVKVFKKLIQKIQERREMVSRTPKKLSTNPLSSPRLLRATLRRFNVFNRERTSSIVVAKQDAGDEEDLEWRNSGYMISDCSACSGSDTTIVKVFKKLIQKIQERREMVSRTPKKLSTNPLSSPRLLRATLRRFNVFNRERTSSM